MITQCPDCGKPRFDWMPSHHCNNDIVYGVKTKPVEPGSIDTTGMTDVMTGAVRDQVMCRINGKYFRCECGCNVFTKLGEFKYKCNSCNATYSGE